MDASPPYWRRGLLAALIVRQFEAIEVLARISLETLRALAATMPQFMMEERKALQAIALRGPGAADQIVPAARAADPDAVGEGYRDWALDIVTPELQLGFHALAHDRAKFDEWMVIAIEGRARTAGDGVRRPRSRRHDDDRVTLYSALVDRRRGVDSAVVVARLSRIDTDLRGFASDANGITVEVVFK